MLELLKESFSVLLEFAQKTLHLTLWAVTGIFILPCVFIANHFFPQWVKWGEDF